MKKIITLFSLAGLSLIMVNCSSSKSTSGTDNSNVAMTSEEKVAEVRKNYSAEKMAEGKTIWESSCNKCHKLFEPQSRNVVKWEAVLPRMVIKAHLTQEQAGMVRAYLLSNAKMS